MPPPLTASLQMPFHAGPLLTASGHPVVFRLCHRSDSFSRLHQVQSRTWRTAEKQPPPTRRSPRSQSGATGSIFPAFHQEREENKKLPDAEALIPAVNVI